MRRSSKQERQVEFLGQRLESFCDGLSFLGIKFVFTKASMKLDTVNILTKFDYIGILTSYVGRLGSRYLLEKVIFFELPRWSSLAAVSIRGKVNRVVCS